MIELESSGNQTEILGTVSGLIREVVGDDFVFDRTIGLDTSFSDDLELESIEFVALAEKLQGHYGKTVDFARWLSSMNLDQILALKVGDLVRYIVQCRS